MAKTVLITGSSSGIGKETAKLFQKNGWNVIATMRSPEKEKELTLLENVFVTTLNVQDNESIQKAVKAGADKFGAIDALVNNAGYALAGAFETAGSEQIKKQYEVNVFGLIDVAQTVLPYLRANGNGIIINISSVGGVVALPFGSLYNSTKFAVEGLSEALSHELATSNIVVKIIEPGSIATNFRNAMQLAISEIPACNDAFKHFFGRFVQMTAHLPKSTAADVANTIYEAVTDGKYQLRYVVGEDAKFLIDLKKKNSDQVFLKLMRDYLIN
jgi:NAD(P)-dependent dehydrogenase (short-subunit alcohol dehydrogenase family)